MHSRRTLTHNLVDLSILLPTNEFLVLVGELNLDTDLVLSLSDKLELRDHGKCALDGIVRASGGKTHPVVRQVCLCVGTDIRQHRSYINDSMMMGWLWLLEVPSSAVELSSLVAKKKKEGRQGQQKSHKEEHKE